MKIGGREASGSKIRKLHINRPVIKMYCVQAFGTARNKDGDSERGNRRGPWNRLETKGPLGPLGPVALLFRANSMDPLRG